MSISVTTAFRSKPTTIVMSTRRRPAVAYRFGARRCAVETSALAAVLFACGISIVPIEHIVPGDSETPSMPWARKFEMHLGMVGHAPWIRPNKYGSAFITDFTDHNIGAPDICVHQGTFRDVGVVSEQSCSHISGSMSCLDGLTHQFFRRLS